jgi:hypothetical protein
VDRAKPDGLGLHVYVLPAARELLQRLRDGRAAAGRHRRRDRGRRLHQGLPQRERH